MKIDMLARNNMFQHIVLGALWVLILAAFGIKNYKLAGKIQGEMILFGDLHGNQSADAKAYRRENTYGGTLG